MAARAGSGALLAALVVVVAACSSSSRDLNSAPPTTASPSSTSHAAASAQVLSFREVLGTEPYGKVADPATCGGGRQVTPPAHQTADAHIVLADRKKTVCYLLGPTLLSTRGVKSAQARADAVTGAWVVNVTFANDDFVRKVAATEVGKQIAIILGGVVEAAPTINAGINGRDVTIAGEFNEATAKRVAGAIAPPGSTSP